MQPIVFTVAEQVAIVNAIVALPAWATAKLHLYSNNLVPNEGNVLTDFTECVYSGYAAQAITWSPAFLDAEGNACSSFGEHIFTQTGATPDICYGFYITDTASAVLLASGAIDGAPFGFSAVGTTLPLVGKIDSNGGISQIASTP